MILVYSVTYAISVYHHLRCEFKSRAGEVYSIQHYVIKFVSECEESTEIGCDEKEGGFICQCSTDYCNKNVITCHKESRCEQTLHRYTQNPLKTEVNSDVLEGLAVPAPHLIPVLLLCPSIYDSDYPFAIFNFFL
jgi:hypothetical protein